MKVYNRNCPCKGCLDRYSTCHNDCEKYKAWKDNFVRTHRYDEIDCYIGSRVIENINRERKKGQYCKGRYKR